jgi:HSP20 family protein
MDRFLDRFFGNAALSEWESDEWIPSIDVSENDGHITVRAEMPGLEAKDIDINVSGDLLTLKGDKKEEKEEKEARYHFKESYAGTFQRVVRLPAEVQSDKANAKFKNGVLDIVLPKARETQTKKIEIKAD